MIVAEPASGSALVQEDGSVLYTNTVSSAEVVSDEFSYRVTDVDGGESELAIVSIAITPAANIPPVAAADSATVEIGGTVSIAVLGNDDDPDGVLVPGSVLLSDPAVGSVVLELDPDESIAGTAVVYTHDGLSLIHI